MVLFLFFFSNFEGEKNSVIYERFGNAEIAAVPCALLNKSFSIRPERFNESTEEVYLSNKKKTTTLSRATVRSFRMPLLIQPYTIKRNFIEIRNRHREQPVSPRRCQCHTIKVQ